ncbi:MAG: four helix bundle protein [Bdellovibrionaceae bacterium]|nr:four helix bundle protein [Pseudobdellovibrionaceae bacterium]
MKSFRTLELAVQFYKLSQNVKTPKHLRDQLDRASSSVSLNLAEGNAKFSYKDKARIYQIAYGSFRECQAIFELVDVEDEELLATSKHLGASLYRLIEGTMARINSENPSEF